MPRIAISYRREDSGVITGRIFDRLVARYGRDSVFRDIDNIPIGANFSQHIRETIANSDVVLAVIGPRWGGRDAADRLANEADLVRIEIESAIAHNVTLIPVLVLGGQMPAPALLPDSLRQLYYRNALRIDADQDFDIHIDRLNRVIDGVLHLRRPTPNKRLRRFTFVAAIAAVPLITAGVSAIWLYPTFRRVSDTGCAAMPNWPLGLWYTTGVEYEGSPATTGGTFIQFTAPEKGDWPAGLGPQQANGYYESYRLESFTASAPLVPGKPVVITLTSPSENYVSVNNMIVSPDGCKLSGSFTSTLRGKQFLIGHSESCWEFGPECKPSDLRSPHVAPTAAPNAK
jgi:hypothetical protein